MHSIRRWWKRFSWLNVWGTNKMNVNWLLLKTDIFISRSRNKKYLCEHVYSDYLRLTLFGDLRPCFWRIGAREWDTKPRSRIVIKTHHCDSNVETTLPGKKENHQNAFSINIWTVRKLNFKQLCFAARGFETTQNGFFFFLRLVSVDVLIELVADVKLNCHGISNRSVARQLLTRFILKSRSVELSLHLRHFTTRQWCEVIISHNASRLSFIWLMCLVFVTGTHNKLFSRTFWQTLKID